MRWVRGLGLVFGLLGPATAVLAEEPGEAPPAASTQAPEGPDWHVSLLAERLVQRKAIYWTGPDTATNLRGWGGQLRLEYHPAAPLIPDIAEWYVVGAFFHAELRAQSFTPTPTLVVEEATAHQSGFLVGSGLRWPLPRIPLALECELGLGIEEIDLDLEYPPGGPPTTHHTDTEVMAQLGLAVVWKVAARLELRAGLFRRLADRSTFLDANNVSLGGYRPDHWAVAFGLAWRL
jgi:hypothetical protein